MPKKFGRSLICFSLFLLVLNYPLNLPAEFYKYVDKQGRTFYVDDLGKVPLEYRNQINVYREKYDDLPADQRKIKLNEDQQHQNEQELEKQRQLELELQQAAEMEEAERKLQEQLAGQKKLETAITIENNRIFVPVTLGNNGIEIPDGGAPRSRRSTEHHRAEKGAVAGGRRSADLYRAGQN